MKGGWVELRGRRRERGLRRGRTLALAGRGREAVGESRLPGGLDWRGLRAREGVVLGPGLGAGWGLRDGGRGGVWR